MTNCSRQSFQFGAETMFDSQRAIVGEASHNITSRSGCGERQRRQQQRVDDAEDRGVRADAQRQRQDCNGGERRTRDKKSARRGRGRSRIASRNRALAWGGCGRRQVVAVRGLTSALCQAPEVVQFGLDHCTAVHLAAAVRPCRAIRLFSMLRELVDDFIRAPGPAATPSSAARARITAFQSGMFNPCDLG